MSPPTSTHSDEQAASLMVDDMKQQASKAARLLRALANERRLLILCHLMQGELSVTELTRRVALGQSALSQHLAILRKDGLVGTRRQSQSIFYSLVPGPAVAVIKTLHSIYCAPEPGQNGDADSSSH